MATAVVTPSVVPETFIQKVEGVEKKFLSVMETAAKDAEKGLGVAVKYLPEAASLAAVIYPPSAAVDENVVTATDLIQKAVVNAEQQYATAVPSDATNAQKLATVLTLAESAVTSLLSKAGITANTAYVTNIINAVVSILKVQGVATS